MKIALIGYGKMGKMIEEQAIARNHEIALKIDMDNRSNITPEQLKQCDVAIEFTTPSSVIDNISWCFNNKIPVIVGTTGWYYNLENVKKECEVKNGTFLYASNFSVGVNIFFALNEFLAKIMNNYPGYESQIEEIHHIHKLDSPSGTGISIAEGIIKNIDSKTSWSEENIKNKTVLPIISRREGEVPGTHIVKYQSDIDDIEIKHIAHNRKGFALGAVIAAEWLKDKKGFHTINEMYTF
jgi:4-hydroxy-tetrahydrodipicolinate reductase